MLSFFCYVPLFYHISLWRCELWTSNSMCKLLFRSLCTDQEPDDCCDHGWQVQRAWKIWLGFMFGENSWRLSDFANQVQKKKIWESVQPLLKTTESCVAVFQSKPMRTSGGVVTCQSLPGANISWSATVLLSSTQAVTLCELFGRYGGRKANGKSQYLGPPLLSLPLTGSRRFQFPQLLESLKVVKSLLHLRPCPVNRIDLTRPSSRKLFEKTSEELLVEVERVKEPLKSHNFMNCKLKFSQ